jgi:hypothetical protein
MIRHWMDKFIPDAAKTLTLDPGHGWERLVQDIEAASRQDAPPVETPTPPAAKDTLH